MKELLDKLVQLQIETYGGSFLLSFSVRKNLYQIRFNNKGKIVSDEDCSRCLLKAIDYIEKHRKETNQKFNYTLFN